MTNGGNCYERGEFWRSFDEGTRGIAGDSDPISCEDNNTDFVGSWWPPRSVPLPVSRDASLLMGLAGPEHRDQWCRWPITPTDQELVWKDAWIQVRLFVL